MWLDSGLKEQAQRCSDFIGATFIITACGGGLVCMGWITSSSAFKSNPIMRISSFHPPKCQKTWKLTKRFVIWEWWASAYSETWGKSVQQTKSHIPSLHLLAYPSPLQDYRVAVYCRYNKSYTRFIYKKTHNKPNLLPYSRSGKSVNSFVTPMFLFMFFALVALLWPGFIMN